MAIVFNEKTKTFYLDGKDFTYAFKINEYDYAEHLYFGKKIDHDDLSHIGQWGRGSCRASMPGIKDASSSYTNVMPEISFYGTGDYREPCVLVENKLGDRLCQLHYVSFEILSEKPKMKGMPSLSGGETLVLHLIDKITNFGADLYYTVYDDASVISRRIVYKNGAKDKVVLKRAYSFTLAFENQEFDIITLHGGWASERNIQKTSLLHGVVSVDSKRTTSSSTLNPFMALTSKNADEDNGTAIGVNLVYSSSDVLKAEGSFEGRTIVTGGVNDFDFSYKLNSGEEFETPEVVIAYSSEGLGGMSRAFHDVYRNHLINPRFVKKPRPIVINNWEGTYFNFTVDKLKAIADGVKGTGIDTFVLDDGWFGKRDNDTSGLGDWVVNEKKLEGGLKSIIDHVHSLGMKFGLWFEPEMISEDSDLFGAHPDYAIGVPNRPRCYSRNQYMLDLTRKDVRDYIVNAVNSVLKENEIDYVKWDYNRNVTESFSQGLDADRQSEFAYRYALGLYDICERIVNANPDVFFEGCAGGGGRFDPAMLHYFPQIWTSDDTDANERTLIQYGTSMVYPLSSMSCHVSQVPNHQTGRITEMKSRADIAHLGSTGYELDASYFTDEDRKLVKEQIEEYKKMQSLVSEGDLYRVENPYESNFFGFCIVSKDKSHAHLTMFKRLCGVNNETKVIYPKGLCENKKYYIKELDMTLSGNTIMNVGFVPNFPRGDFQTLTYTFEEK